mmetsp:Transcript_2750/g.8430  ORF Transcript_2750/g.8430 Transcript_2750/m.8430 type:complete len:201 (+) Transcript_2750:557-1159(+)
MRGAPTTRRTRLHTCTPPGDHHRCPRGVPWPSASDGRARGILSGRRAPRCCPRTRRGPPPRRPLLAWLGARRQGVPRHRLAPREHQCRRRPTACGRGRCRALGRGLLAALGSCRLPPKTALGAVGGNPPAACHRLPRRQGWQGCPRRPGPPRGLLQRPRQRCALWTLSLQRWYAPVMAGTWTTARSIRHRRAQEAGCQAT